MAIEHVSLPRVLQNLFELLRSALNEWGEDRASTLGAAVAYYAIFSLAPLLIILVAVAGLAFGEKAVRGEIVGDIAGIVGLNTAEMIQTMLADAGRPTSSPVATVIGVVTLLLGTTGFFAEIQDDLNTLWHVRARPRGIVATIRARFTAFLVVMGIAILLLLSLAASAGLAAIERILGDGLPASASLLQASTFVTSLSLGTVLFAVLFKVLPDAAIDWRDAWVGAMVTSSLVTIGQLIIGIVVAYSGIAWAYGAAGSLVVLLFWVFYSAQIFFFGAEFTRVFAKRYGNDIRPSADAVPVIPLEPAPAPRR